jgi:diadenylate cyclase
MTSRMVREVERDCVELGSEGRLILAQLEELSGTLPQQAAAVVADYQSGVEPEAALEQLAALPYESLLEAETLQELLGFPSSATPIETVVSPRGYRALAQIPRIPSNVIRRVVSELEGLDAIARASLRELEALDGVSAMRAREIKEGLRRLQEHNLVERYLSM